MIPKITNNHCRLIRQPPYQRKKSSPDDLGNDAELIDDTRKYQSPTFLRLCTSIKEKVIT
ncbi:MAG: hypothetical protein IKP67_07615 [Spirochaetales bacterium]|nr:hypothetical protein [Spirochaetales bacterium]